MATGKQEIRRRAPKIFRILHSHLKLVLSMVFGAVVAALLPPDWGAITRSLVGWDAAVLVYLSIVYWVISRSEVKHISLHAEREDEGRVAVLTLTVAATIVSVAAIILLLGMEEGRSEPLQLGFAITTVMLSWTFVHSIFALHYAHEYYDKDESGGGLRFPGETKPDYLDFVYFSFVIGMTFQVSDVAVTSRSIRRAVIAHGIISFLFNVALLSIMINLAANAI